MGKAIVASKLGQMEKILKHNETAYRVEPGNVDELTKGIVILVKNKVLRYRLGENARKEVKNYTWKQHTKRILNKSEALTGKKL